MTDDSEILIYAAPDGVIKIDVHLENDTVWLTQADMARLFRVTPQSITIHLRNIYEEGELSEDATCKDYLQVQVEGTRNVERQKKFYNLDAIISVGYRIKSTIATQFRIWATQKLKEYIVKGFALNDERFKSGSSMNYFTELQERIREIRLSERFFYQKIKDIYTTSIDYDSKDEKTREFFKIIQNKLLWAISQQTAAELIYRRVDASSPLLGMQSYDKSAVSVRKKDVIVAKNYLAELYGVETKRLNEQVTRNLERFPDDFMIHLAIEEANILRLQFATIPTDSHFRYRPRVIHRAWYFNAFKRSEKPTSHSGKH